MLIKKEFIELVMESSSIQRWNDQIRPAEFTELDKHAHKMIIVYVLGKFEEERGNESLNWTELIEGGIFEFLQRTVLTDLKPQLYHKIRADKAKYRQLNDWIFSQMSDCMTPFGDEFKSRFVAYFRDETKNVNTRILSAAHFLATKWEFNIIERNNPDGFEIPEIKASIDKIQEKFYDLNGIKQLALYSGMRNFVEICGQLRFQQRWSHIYRYPKTSVLGHTFLVALFSYLMSLRLDACEKRKYNNFFGGLFHDLPEVLTRDIITPVKMSVEGLSEIIKEYEKEEMEKRIFKMLPAHWHEEMRLFTENEFKSIVLIRGRRTEVCSDAIGNKYNKDKYSPIDGEIIRFCDHACAFIEAYMSLEYGIKNKSLKKAVRMIKKKYSGVKLAGMDADKFFSQFK